jgi:biopolymer transport protein ExbB
MEPAMLTFLRCAFCIIVALLVSCLTADAQGAGAPSTGAVIAQSQAEPVSPNTIVASTKGGVLTGIHELSPWSMFLNADLVVKAVILGLVFASLITWTVFVGKFVELFIVKRRLARALGTVSRTRSLGESYEELRSDGSVMRTFIATAINESRLSSGIDNEAGIKERTASSFAEITRTESRRIRFGMGLLATIAATSPFVGLFGTVWGIMNSFIGISKSQTTNLAVVAPGIAEALLATAIGLVAAIPAVIIYNHFSRVTKGYLELVNKASGAAGRQLSRDLDAMQSGPLRRAAE